MVLLVLASRLLLALVFVGAGVAKLRDRPGFRTTLTAFGVTGSSATLGAALIPLAELAVGVALLLTPLTSAALFGAGILLVAFTAAAGITLARGSSPDCACFGSTAAEPIGRSTLIRNSGLLALTILVVWEGPGDGLVNSIASWLDLPIRERLLGGFSVALLAALSALSASHSRLRSAHHLQTARVTTLESQLRQRAAATTQDLGAGGLPVGSSAPSFDLPCLEGDRASLESLTSGGRAAALIFLSAHCPACQELWPDIERWQSRNGSRLSVAVVCSGSAQSIEMKVMGHTISNLVLEGDAQVAESYALSLKPTAVIVGPTGLVESRSVAGVGAIRALVNAAQTVE